MSVDTAQMDEDIAKFEDKDEEIQYLREYIAQLQQELDDSREDTRRVEHDFEEFQENSKLLEKELETALEQSEKSNRELRMSHSRLQAEHEKLRERADQVQRLLDLRESEVSKYKSNEDDLVKRLRELEQRNDDLERALRVMSTSKGETESKLNAAIERDALLECEQEELLAMVQRLKDEKRDLYQELKIRDKSEPDNDKNIERGRSPIDSNKLMVEIETQTATTGSPLKIGQNGEGQNIPLTPSNRILSMNIVSDLLRNIGSVESKLTCGRTASRESSHPNDLSNRDVYRSRRVPRSTASPTIQGYLRA